MLWCARGPDCVTNLRNVCVWGVCVCVCVCGWGGGGGGGGGGGVVMGGGGGGGGCNVSPATVG